MEGPVGVGVEVADPVADPVAVLLGGVVELVAEYRLRRLPEPQNSVPFPRQTMLQSVAGAGADPAARLLAQYCSKRQPLSSYTDKAPSLTHSPPYSIPDKK
jgi:hypothetical protein